MKMHWFAIAAALTAVSTPAFAEHDNGRRGREERRERGERHERASRGAPEPLTLVGLGLGAGTIGVAAWRSRRKKG